MQIVEEILRGVRRAFRSDFLEGVATEAERAKLAESGVTTHPAQDLAAWRHSLLLLAAGLLVVAAVISIVQYESAEDGFTDMLVQVERDAGQLPNELKARRQVRHAFGEGNLRLLDWSAYLEILALAVAAACTAVACARWRSVLRSRRIARIGWCTLLGVPLLLAALPWAKILDFSHLDAEWAGIWEGVIATIGMMYLLLLVAPRVVAIFPGIIRGAMSMKTLLPESALPGYVAIMCAPIYGVFLVVVFSAINQYHGDLKLLTGLASLIAGATVYVIRAKSLARSHSAEEAATSVRRVRKTAATFNVTGVLLLSWFLVALPDIKPLDVVGFFTTAGGGLLLMMVVSADFLLVLISREHAQAHRFHASPLAHEFEKRLSDLGAVLGPHDTPPA